MSGHTIAGRFLSRENTDDLISGLTKLRKELWGEAKPGTETSQDAPGEGI